MILNWIPLGFKLLVKQNKTLKYVNLGFGKAQWTIFCNFIDQTIYQLIERIADRLICQLMEE